MPDRLSLTGKRWTLPETQDSSLPLAKRLQLRRDIPLLAPASDLAAFGHDATVFPDLPKALERIARAIERKERIGIFGDYDCDGITSTALLVRFFRRRGIDVSARLPHRLHEGYGLKMPIIDEFREKGIHLLITVDTGISAAAEIDRAREAGIDVIILDHHHVPAVLPKAHAILHPLLAPAFTDAPPCAAGIAWSLVEALERRDGHAEWDDRETDIALAAIGTVADLVELTGGNRTLTHRGLQALGRSEGSLKLLLLQAGLSLPLTSRDIGFRIAPRLNAAGRMADPSIALWALLGNREAITQLEALNRERQATVTRLCEGLLTSSSAPAPFLCMRSEEYLPGICGLLSGKLTETFGRPSLVAHLQGDLCVASLRSIPAYHLTKGLERASHLLTNFGGHAMAAGCSFEAKNFDALSAHLIEDVSRSVSPEDLIPVLPLDMAVSAHELDLPLLETLQSLEPFGQGNPEPRFLLQNVTLQDSRAVGAKSNHLQAKWKMTKLIGFGLGHLLQETKEPIDLAVRIGMDTWNGRKNVQLFIDDMRKSVVQNSSVIKVSDKNLAR